jgi:phosphopantothenoylcysteine decarboxylase / phosphopantothenate---cysteine ligase
VLKSRRIVLGVSGGIAAYKAADLVSKLAGSGAEVRVVMTAAATRFVSALTFESLSGNPVAVDTFDRSISVYPHLELAQWGELLVVAPATADILGKAAGGIADEMLSTTLLSFDGPVLFAPAMNSRMWKNPAVQHNHELLGGRGCYFIGPAEGKLACGETGIGRMSEVAEIIKAIGDVLAAGGNSLGRGEQGNSQ